MAGIFAFVAIASLGLPGLAGFWGEVGALLSSFEPNVALGLDVGLYRTFMIIGGIGTVLTAGYFLWMLQRVNMGTLPERWREAGFSDIVTVEWLAWVPLLLLVVVLGLFPGIVFGMTDETVRTITGLFGG
jgi:NADH-quinone oxidoreductase subunit M